MDSANVFLAVLNGTAFVICVTFLAYVASVIPAFLRAREFAAGDRRDASWHIVVPCLNEERVIVTTVDHLCETFPQAHVWCIDDASDDSTPVLLGWLARRHPQVHVVTRYAPDARVGKGGALNAAWDAISRWLPPETDRSRVIVGVVDADGGLDPVCPDVIMGPELFGDPSVGAVQVQVRITQDTVALVSTDLAQLRSRDGRARVGRDPVLVHLQDLEFAGPIAAMQFFRRRTGTVAMGGNGQFTRMSVLDLIAAQQGTPWHGALLEDFELGLHVLLSGYRSEYCHDTFVAQTGLVDVRALIRQRTRWTQGSMQCLKYLWEVLNSPAIKLSGALEIAYYMYIPVSQILGSVVFPLSAAVHITYALRTPEGIDRWLLEGSWGLIPLGLLFGVLPHALWGFFYRSHCASLVSRRQAVWMAVVNVGYGYLLQISAWRALYRVVRQRDDWAKTARTGERHGVADVSGRPVPSQPVPSQPVTAS